MSNSIAPGSSADVNVRVTALTTNPNVPAQYKTIILKKNLVNGVNTLTQEMMSATNTKYVVKYDYVLGEDITVPANCILEFDGGSVSGAYTLTGNNTGVKAGLVKIFDTTTTVAGTWNVAEAYPEWFGALGDNSTNDREAVQKTIDSFDTIKFKKSYYIDGDNIYILKDYLTICGNGTLSIDNQYVIYVFNSDHLTIKDINIYSVIASTGIMVYISSVQIVSTATRFRELTKTVCQNYFFENLHIDNHTNGIAGEKTFHGIGLTTWNTAQLQNIKVLNCTINQVGPNAVNESADCIYVAGYQTLVSDILIDGCTLLNARRNCISIASANGIPAEHVVISNNYIKSPRFAGIDLEFSIYTTVVSNHFVDCGNNIADVGQSMRCGVSCATPNKNRIPVIDSCIFENCNNGIGGAYINAVNCKFYNTFVGADGSQAVAGVFLKDCYIYGNINKTILSTSGELTIDSCDILIENAANKPVNFYFVDTQNGYIVNTRFKITYTGSESDTNAIYADTNGELTFSDCTFEISNHANTIYLYRQPVNINGCKVNTDGVFLAADAPGTNIKTQRVTNSNIDCVSLYRGNQYGIGSYKLKYVFENNIIKLAKAVVCQGAESFIIRNNTITLSSNFDDSVPGSGTQVLHAVFFSYPQTSCLIDISNNRVLGFINTAFVYVRVGSNGPFRGVVKNNLFESDFAMTFSNIISGLGTGQFSDVEDFGNVYKYNSQWTALMSYPKSGTARPSFTSFYTGINGFQFFDETLGKPIYWNGTAWVDATGTLV